jgi:hypothetical protein
MSDTNAPRVAAPESSESTHIPAKAAAVPKSASTKLWERKSGAFGRNPVPRV